MEVVVPFWAKDVLLSDVARRNGGGYGAASDADVAAIFSAANTNVQYVYDWHPLPAAAVAWPATIPALIYPAGAFVKGTVRRHQPERRLRRRLAGDQHLHRPVLRAGHPGRPDVPRPASQVTIPVCNAGRHRCRRPGLRLIRS